LSDTAVWWYKFRTLDLQSKARRFDSQLEALLLSNLGQMVYAVMPLSPTWPPGCSPLVLSPIQQVGSA